MSGFLVVLIGAAIVGLVICGYHLSVQPWDEWDETDDQDN